MDKPGSISWIKVCGLELFFCIKKSMCLRIFHLFTQSLLTAHGPHPLGTTSPPHPFRVLTRQRAPPLGVKIVGVFLWEEIPQQGCGMRGRNGEEEEEEINTRILRWRALGKGERAFLGS